MAICRFKVIISGNKKFGREYEIKDSSTLYDFHKFIQNDLDFDDAQLAVFFISNKKWDRIKPISLFDMGDGAMESYFIADLITKENNYLIYMFDMYNNRHLQIEFIGKVDAEIRASYPRTTFSKGNPPGQFSGQQEQTDIDTDELDQSFESDDLNSLTETDDV